jgi:arabinofuranan 3-O-arabinosyltransferase
VSSAADRLRSSRSLPLAVLALLAYLPAFTAAPGRMPADTKMFLYLDPGGLVRDAPFSWDTSQFGGWFPHQTITYLWPSGPWFWFFDLIGTPDWIAHRLWIGTILFLGGAGVLWVARLLGMGTGGAFSAAAVYQLSPFVLPYISRTSLMLLPWTAVGWLVGLTVLAARRGGWRYPALMALVLATVGSPNATALAMIAPAPVLWLAHEAWSRRISLRVAVTTALRIGSLALAVSLWWIVMLSQQSRFGADVLAYSESLRAVSTTAVSTETLRGLGYWLFYVRDAYGFATTASIPYAESGRVIMVGYALLVVCLLGLTLTRWAHRGYAILLVVVGIVLAVGVHPIDDPSPLMSPVAEASRSSFALALRSSTRALPLSTFGLALGAGALVTALAGTKLRARSFAPLLVLGLAVVNLPALHQGGFVDVALERDQDLPRGWTDAAAALDATSHESRVLQLPGAEFGAYRWGYTVDPPQPGILDKPYISRDLLPLGSPGVMDLLYALDDRWQSGIIEPDAIAPVARLLAVDTIWAAGDAEFDRFRTPRPELVSRLYAARPTGLGAAVPYGDVAPNLPTRPMIDETSLSQPAVGTPLPSVELVPVLEPTRIARAASQLVVLAGSGDGIVDAAAAGLLRGDEALLYAADITDPAEVRRAGFVIVTDSNRDRAHHWRGSQDVIGFSESGGPDRDVLRDDGSDTRLAVFPTEDAAQQTTVRLAGGLVVRASGYGSAFAYQPERRPSMAVDGDPSTAWIVGDRFYPEGDFLEVSSTNGVLVLLQPQNPRANRRITEVRIEAPDIDAAPTTVVLDDRSMVAPGQSVEVPAGTRVRIVITRVADRPEGTDTGGTGVGFAEIGVAPQREVTRVPTGVLADVAPGTPTAIVLTRLRSNPLDRWRSDPEVVVDRTFDVPGPLTATPSVTLRLHRRADDRVLAELAGLGAVTVADSRLTGDPRSAGRFATDGDADTAWTSPFVHVVGSTLTIPTDPSVPIDRLVLRQRIDDLHSIITGVRLSAGDRSVDLVVPAPDPTGASSIDLGELGIDALAGSAVQLVVTAIEPRTTIDRRYSELTTLPVSLTEVELAAIMPDTAAPGPVASDCRDDLVAIDGIAVPLAVDADALRRLLDGEAVTVGRCDGGDVSLGAGEHRITTSAGPVTGIDVDRVVLISGTPPAATPAIGVTIDRSRTSRTLTVEPCPVGCWVVLGEGLNPGWQATSAGAALPAGRQISGGFNGWWLDPSDEPTELTVTWAPQRAVTIGLALSLLAVIGCIALAVRSRRRIDAGPLTGSTEPPVLDRDVLAPASRRDAVASAVVLVAGATLVVSPLYGAIAAVVAVVVVLTRRPVIAGITSVVLAAGLGSVVLLRELRSRFFASAAWPSNFEDLHRAGLLVVVLLAAAMWPRDEVLPHAHDADADDAEDATGRDTYVASSGVADDAGVDDLHDRARAGVLDDGS